MSDATLRCVVDATIGIKLVLPEAGSDKARALFAALDASPGTVLFVPDLFFIECGNVVWKHVRRGTCTWQQTAPILLAYRTMLLTTVSTAELYGRAVEIGLRHGITAYDACYVALAEREGVPLVTADDRLCRVLAGAPFTIQSLAAFIIPAPPLPPGSEP
jgi:predicted nucleic acid-binding protein